MNRRLLVFAIIIVNFVVAITLLQTPLDAAPTGQAANDVPAVDVTQEPLAQPLAVTIRQRLPVTLTFSGATTATITQSMPVTLAFDLQLMLTQTLTSTVQSTVTLTLSNGVTVTAPISLELGVIPSTTLVITPLATITPTAIVASTPTATVTPTPTPTTALTPTPTIVVTPTVVITSAPPITSTVNITANLRSGPGETFPSLGLIGGGQPVVVVGINADGNWFLLENGAWIFTTLIDNPPPNPPLADEALATTVQATATARANLATPTATATTTPTATVAATPAATPTPQPVLLPTPTPTVAPVAPSVTVNANLREGPGLEFPILGGTIAGQTINIVARNAVGDWFLLDNGGWVAASLVANPPNLTTVPVFGEGSEITPTAPLTPTASLTATTGVTTTESITGGTATTATAPVNLSVLDNLYLVDAAEVVARYDRALGDLDTLIAQAGQDTTRLQDPTWIQSMTNAIALLRATNARVRTLQPSAVTESIQNSLVAAANAYDTAAPLLAAGVDEGSPATFDEALAAMTRGTISLNSAGDEIDALTP